MQVQRPQLPKLRSPSTPTQQGNGRSTPAYLKKEIHMLKRVLAVAVIAASVTAVAATAANAATGGRILGKA